MLMHCIFPMFRRDLQLPSSEHLYRCKDLKTRPFGQASSTLQRTPRLLGYINVKQQITNSCQVLRYGLTFGYILSVWTLICYIIFYWYLVLLVSSTLTNVRDHWGMFLQTAISNIEFFTRYKNKIFLSMPDWMKSKLWSVKFASHGGQKF